VDVEGRGHAAAAAEEVIEGHPGQLALDVPEGHVDAGHSVVQHRAAAPVGADRQHRPDVLDIVYRAADDLRLQVFLDGGDHRQRALGERGTPQPIESWFVGFNFHDD
jgi:hypothetical protein